MGRCCCKQSGSIQRWWCCFLHWAKVPCQQGRIPSSLRRFKRSQWRGGVDERTLIIIIIITTITITITITKTKTITITITITIIIIITITITIIIIIIILIIIIIIIIIIFIFFCTLGSKDPEG